MYTYKLVEGEEHPLFIFTTDQGDIINVEFIPTPYKDIDGVEEIYSIDVSSVSNNGGKIIKDESIGQTVSQIISDFMQDNTNILLNYVCDSLDKKEHLRHRKFCSWSELYKEEAHEILYYQFASNDTTYYTSFIFDSSQLDVNYVTDICDKEMNDLTNK